MLALGLRSHTDIPALKELEEWFDSQKEIRGIAKLNPFFERTSKLASRRLKREIERRGTLENLRPSTRRVYVAGARAAIRAASLELWQRP
jgi:hypothetical protein